MAIDKRQTGQTTLTDWLALHHAPGIGAATCRRLLEALGNPAAVRRAPSGQLQSLGLSPQAIEALQPEGLSYHHACGRIPVSGLLLAARHHHLKVNTLDLCNSGDTAGPRNHVVGYGAYAFS